MKLQHKAWALVLVIVGLCAGGAMLGARHIVLSSFQQIEAERAELEGERARRVLDQQLQNLGFTVRDYAAWADAVDFVHGRQTDFIDENFDTESLANLRVSQLFVHDASGRALASLVVRDGAVQTGSLPTADLIAAQALAVQVLKAPDPRTVLKSLRMADGVLEMVVVAAIHWPDRPERGSQGAITMIRRLDAQALERFSEVLMTPVRVALEEHALGEFHQHERDEDKREVHVKLRDHAGHVVAELVLQLDQRLLHQGRVLAWTGMGLAAVAGLLAAFLLVSLLDRLVLRRLQRLHADVSRITAQGPQEAAPVAVHGQDELRQLGDAINLLLLRVRQDAQAQTEAHERQEQLQTQLLQSQKTEALGRLTGGIAHDFNNSLAAITGWVRLAAEDMQDPDHPSAEALQQALKATRYADGLMRQLLAFGRQTPPKLRRLHWSALIEDTRQMVASGLTRDCDIVVDYQVDNDEVDVDPTQLQQVLVNLLINASDAMQGKGRIELTLSSFEWPMPDGQVSPPGAVDLPAGAYITLRLCDQGPGIPPENLGRVFDPFFTTKGKGRGTGLGLSVAHGIVLRHHGGIGVANRPEGGACFHVHLPVSRREASVEPVTAPDGGPGQGRHVLFVDDDQLVRHAWSALLERQGWLITRARDGEEGWAQYAQSGQRFDLVLTDQSMPRLDGVGLARRIRETESPPPVILISGHVNEVGAGDLQTLFSAVLHKPVDMGDLTRVMEEVLATGSSRY